MACACRFDIGQGLLRDAVKRDLGLAIQTVSENDGVEVDRNARSLPEFVGERLDGGTKAQIIQYARAQVPADPADFGDGGSKVLDAILKGLVGFGVVALVSPARCVERVSDTHQHLADPVVQFPCHAPTFFLPARKRPVPSVV